MTLLPFAELGLESLDTSARIAQSLLDAPLINMYGGHDVSYRHVRISPLSRQRRSSIGILDRGDLELRDSQRYAQPCHVCYFALRNTRALLSVSVALHAWRRVLKEQAPPHLTDVHCASRQAPGWRFPAHTR